MSVDLSAVLSDLVADVVAEVQKVANDPLTALDNALDAKAAAESEKNAWLRRTAEERARVQLTTQSRYNANTEAYLGQVADALSQGLTRVPNNPYYLQGTFTEAVKPYAREYHRLTQACKAADQEISDIRASIEMADLPVGALVSFATKVGQYAYNQIGTIQKVTDASYVVALESWHPRHQSADTDAATARIDRVKGIRRIGYTGGRSLEVIGSPARSEDIRARATAWVKAKSAAHAYEQRVAQAGRDSKGAYDRQVQAQNLWDQQYRHAGNDALSEAQRQVLEKYASEVQALATTFTVRKREALGQRPEVTAPRVTQGYYFNDFATPEEKAELSRLQAEEQRLQQEVYQS